ncbi:MAG: putative O-glycosylation ligase, exosortase A system-associated [Deltaproteobacteria bacterium]|nr:putative O-glycosylation ligase, exosortase A system-associated [bacterium]MCB9477025.1 putative O-glycosylation ligase, exosortase A system-associated [Deltaproteobacteria bacterium]MCB9479647.1 putative O-glycosylation ligase, exosortase A system-associated [Deltaproteobacteria bacterium]MCB9489856.1 putative O-glycosylation ligase, exosortase A system-associated [Deltaproteobacteria bacterium]
MSWTDGLSNNRPLALLGLGTFCAVLALAMLKVDGIFILGGLLALGVGVLLLSFPFACVPIYFIFLYTRPGDAFPFLAPLRLNALIVLAMAASFLLRVLVFRTTPVRKNLQIVVVVAFLGTIGISIFGSFYASATLEKFMDIVRVIIMVVLVTHIVDSMAKLRITVWSILLSLALLATINFGGWAMGLYIIDNGGSGGIVGGFLGDGNDFALAMNVMMPFAIAFVFIEKSKWLKLLAIYVILIYIAAIVATYSRGGLLGLVAVFGMMFVLYIARTREWGKGLMLIIVAAILGVIALSVFAPDSFQKRMGTITEFEEDESALGRLDAWEAGLRMLKDHPLFGVGAGAFPDAYGRKYMPPDAIEARWRAAHSLYVEISAELGFTGITLLMFLAFLIFRDARRVHRYGLMDPRVQRDNRIFADAIVSGLIGYLVSGAFLSVGYYPHIYILSVFSILALDLTREAAEAGAATESEEIYAR